MKRRGTLVAIEGIDGSGKGTQADRLCDSLKQAGNTAVKISFPRYEETFFATRVADFLNGEFGALDEVHPLFAALLFAGDRFESRSLIEESLAHHDYVVLDRYVASNVAHQSAKRTGDRRTQLAGWIQWLEYEVYELPRADRVILLDIPVQESARLIARKGPRGYTKNPADLQEADGRYLAEVRNVYLDMAASEPSWQIVPVVRDGALANPEDIARDVLALAVA